VLAGHIRRLKLEQSQVIRIDVTDEIARTQFEKGGVSISREDTPRKLGDDHFVCSADQLLLVYRICRLMLGKQFLLAAVTPVLIAQLHANEVDAVTQQFKRFSGVGVDATAIRCFVRQLCSLVSDAAAAVADLFPARAVGGTEQLLSWRDQSSAECISSLTRLLGAAVRNNDLETDVPLEDFVRQHAVMSFLPQKMRLELWLASLVRRAIDQPILIELPDGHNVHCLQPLVYFCGEPCFEPGYVSVPRVSVVADGRHDGCAVVDKRFDLWCDETGSDVHIRRLCASIGAGRRV